MRTVFLVAFALMLVGKASAVDFDGTAAIIGGDKVKAIEKAAISELQNPADLRLKQLSLSKTTIRPGAEIVCGLISSRDTGFGYTGFRPFIYMVESNTLSLFYFPNEGLGGALQSMNFKTTGCAAELGLPEE